MAKKTSKKAGKTASGSRDQAAGKSSQSRASLVAWALVEKALGRASASVKKSIDDGASLKAGSYPVDITVRINGDILIEAGSKGGVKSTKASITPEDLLGAMLAADPDRDATIARAIKRIKDARKGGDEARHAMTRGWIQGVPKLIEELATKHKLTEEVESKPKAGACKGTPSVAVSGSIGKHAVKLDLDNASEQGKAA